MKSEKAKKRGSKKGVAAARGQLDPLARCDHLWNYEHTLWAGREGHDEVAVGRYCAHCGKLQTATAHRWHSLPKGYVDMRETMETAIKASSGADEPHLTAKQEIE